MEEIRPPFDLTARIAIELFNPCTKREFIQAFSFVALRFGYRKREIADLLNIYVELVNPGKPLDEEVMELLEDAILEFRRAWWQEIQKFQKRWEDPSIAVRANVLKSI